MHMLQYCQLINLFLAKMFMLNQLEFFLRGKRDLYYSRAKKVLPTQARDIVQAGAEPDHSMVLILPKFANAWLTLFRSREI